MDKPPRLSCSACGCGCALRRIEGQTFECPSCKTRFILRGRMDLEKVP